MRDISPNRISLGFKLLIFFYIFIISQHFTMRRHFNMNALLEAVFIGTLVYLIIGFFRRDPVSRWTGIVFHTLFQVMETVAIFMYFDPKILAIMLKELPAGTLEVARASLVIVFSLVTLVNISAVVYLLKRKSYFAEREAGEKETA